MKAAVLQAVGEAPAYGDFADPVAADGETIVRVTAAALKQLDRAIARGTHYASPRTLPVISGTDGAGRLQGGERVYFAANRRPFGAMAERAPASWHLSLPEGVDDATAAALVNPALAAWLPLSWRASMQPGETVLVIGATGASGRLAVTAARLLGAARIVAAGRRTDTLAALGADAVIDLKLKGAALRHAFAEAAGPRGYDVIVDYVWGEATEALIATLGTHDLDAADREGGSDVRLVNVGSMGGPDIVLPATALRSGWLRIIGSGTGNYPPLPKLKAYVTEILDFAANGTLRMETQTVALADVTRTWEAPEQSDRRIVLVP